MFLDQDEACPPRYISEYCNMDDKNETQLDMDFDRTVASSNSFCSLHTIENLDALDQYDGKNLYENYKANKIS